MSSSQQLHPRTQAVYRFIIAYKTVDLNARSNGRVTKPVQEVIL